MNKADVAGSQQIERWARDFGLFEETLTADDSITPTIRSIALWIEEFYKHFSIFHVSAAAGTGKAPLLSALGARAAEQEQRERESAEACKPPG